MIVSRQFNYNIPVRSYSISNSKKDSKINGYGVLQTPKICTFREEITNELLL